MENKSAGREREEGKALFDKAEKRGNLQSDSGGTCTLKMFLFLKTSQQECSLQGLCFFSSSSPRTCSLKGHLNCLQTCESLATFSSRASACESLKKALSQVDGGCERRSNVSLMSSKTSSTPAVYGCSVPAGIHIYSKALEEAAAYK